MTGSSAAAGSSAQHIAGLLSKFNNQDPDIRYMSLNDLHQILVGPQVSFLTHDYTICARVVDGFLRTLNDQNGDVQNMAIKCLGPFINKSPSTIWCPMIDKVSNIKVESNVDASVPALAVRAIVSALPRPSPGTQRQPEVEQGYDAVSKAVIPRLVGYVIIPINKGNAMSPGKGMLEVEIETGLDTNALDILTEVARCFGPMLQEVELKALQKITLQILESDKCSSVMKKKAVAALSILAQYFPDTLLSSFVSYTIEVLGKPTLVPSQKKLFLSIYSSTAKTLPRRFGPYLKILSPIVLGPLSQHVLDQEVEARQDDEDFDSRDPQIDEVRETALLTIDAFCTFCPQDMLPYTNDVLETALRFLKYDPNFAGQDEDMDMDDDDDFDMDGDEDFEEETGFDDEDDVSWKARRCAAKLLHTLINSRTLLPDGDAYSKIAPVLISRFTEREETVRLEIFATLTTLVNKARDTYQPRTLRGDASAGRSFVAGRKRRRGSSNAGMSDGPAFSPSTNGLTSPVSPGPRTQAQQSLAAMAPDVVQACVKLLKSSAPATKQACVALLNTMVHVQHGGLSAHMSELIDLLVDMLDTLPGTGSASSATTHSARISVLALLSAIADFHPTDALLSSLSKVVPALITTSKDNYGKVAVEAICAVEAYIRALTSPRNGAVKSQAVVEIGQLHDTLVERITASDTDTEARQKAVVALGVLISRTSGTKGQALLSFDSRVKAQDLILERMKNELTRSSAVHAIELIAALAQTSQDFTPNWVQQASLELAAQLRKSSRSLRGSSLSALKLLATNPCSRQLYDDETMGALVDQLIPLLGDSDLHMLGPALITLNAYAKEKPALVLTDPVIAAICKATKLNLQGTTLEALLEVVDTFGRSQLGKPLMQALLTTVGVSGNAEIVGQVIGALLVGAKGQNVGVTLDNFKSELQTSQDDKRQCLALYILGEAGLRLGPSSPLTREDFDKYFSSPSEKVQLAAAISLGRAGAGNVSAFLPAILEASKNESNYLLLHSTREMLQHTSAEAELLQFSRPIWEMILKAAKDEDNKALGAECIGRLAVIDPADFVPQLQQYLTDPEPAVRGMIISAFRYTFTDTDASYDSYLQPIIVHSLTTMLNEDNLENRRLALSTFNSAAHNKPQLILPHLTELLPLTMRETIVRPELIREVAMGPFKHKVDDGLELRKSAYETLYALMDLAFYSFPLQEFFERVIAGVGDEHEIKIICCLMISKLVTLAPVEVTHSLDPLATAFRKVLEFKPKENAVKQELEKVQEHNKALLKTMLNINKAFPAATQDTRSWQEAFDWAKKEHVQTFRSAEEEMKEKDF